MRSYSLRLTITAGLFLALVDSLPAQKFLSFPLSDASVPVWHGWLYDDGSYHGAVDYPEPLGTPVLAAADGIAMASSQVYNPSQDTYGTLVLIQHTNGFSTLYAHLSASAPGIVVFGPQGKYNSAFGTWTSVRKGDVIGFVGLSGVVTTTRSHLHFEVANNRAGTYIGHIAGRVDSYSLFNVALFYPPSGPDFTTCGTNFLWLTCPIGISPPVTGSVSMTATLDGSTWPSCGTAAVNYTITGPGGPVTGTGVAPLLPVANLQAGAYTLTYASGGPANSTLAGVSPCQAVTTCTATLTAGQTLAFTLQFKSNPPTAGFTMSSGGQGATDGQQLSIAVPTGTSATVSFDGTTRSFAVNGGAITRWLWFIDSAIVATTGTFSQSLSLGTHTVSLVVTDSRNTQSAPASGTVKVTASTNTWAHTWGGSGSDSITSVATDASGNVYAAGATSSFGAGGNDLLLLKYDSQGNLLWRRTWGGSGDEGASGVGLDSAGNVYVVGSTDSFGAGWYDALILKFDASGNLIWSRTWGGGGYDAGYDVAFDASGNVYVAAESYSLGNRAVLLKFDSNGNLLNSHAWKGPATYDSGYSVDVDKNGNVVLAGVSWDYSVYPNHNSILVVKFDNQGNLLWNRNLVSGAEDEASGAKIVRFDGSGNIFIAGHRTAVCNTSNFSTCNFDADVIKLDANGNQLWATSWGGAGFESSSGLAFDSSGNLIVSGTTNSFLSGASAELLLKINPAGAPLASQVWGGTGSVNGSGVTVDGSGAIITGGSAPNATSTWQTVIGSSSTLSFTITSPSGNVTTSALSLGTPVGTVTQPVGVSDTGRGGQDALVIKTILQ